MIISVRKSPESMVLLCTRPPNCNGWVILKRTLSDWRHLVIILEISFPVFWGGQLVDSFLLQFFPGLSITTILEVLNADGHTPSKRQLLERHRKPLWNSSSFKNIFNNFHEREDGPGAEALEHVLMASSSSALEKGGNDQVVFWGKELMNSRSHC